ncbi:MAG TPA: TonB-dependent receptor [Vicinamibacterales bacterium]|nr:TonB-dependent receptor [Vicinamibacterales bacterium]
MQTNVGASGQITWLGGRAASRHQLTIGGAFDASRVDFQQLSQFGYLNPDRSITPVNAFADGSTNVDGVPFDTRVNLHGAPQTWGTYATDTISFGDVWHATVSARFNHVAIDNSDRLPPASGPGSLTGSYQFDRVNPAAGLTFSPVRAVNLYVNYSEGSRAPTSIELGCADPTQPCKLPNAMAGDPPLNQVVTRSWEAGIRSGATGALTWSAGVFRAANHNDILFVASTQTGFGYFKNFGETLRQGVELSATRRFRRLTIGGGYTFLDATYQSTETFDGSSNSTNDSALAGEKGVDGTIQIQPGDRMPLIPRQTVKLFADVPVTPRLSIDLDLVGTSSLVARGNENNLDQPDGVYYIGPGVAPGYAVVNFGAQYQLTRRLRLIAQINNLFDQHYYTGAQLGSTGLTSSGSFIARPFPAVNGDFPVQQAAFYAPGAPTTFWVGLRVRL